MVVEETKLTLGSVSDINFDIIENSDPGENEEFYEKIEAPKFVDFTVPNHYGPDDRYWFCLRVGCDQKHEEEMDSETIYKKFVLRVMAARSPNVRLQKVLHRNACKNSKYPLSAPPKTYKSMLPRLAVVSSLSKRIIGEEIVKVKLQSKVVSSTPKVKGKQVSSKYLTTPSYKKCPPNPNSFQSVGKQPKSPTLLPPKSRIIAKTLTFQTPPKTTLNLMKSLAPVANLSEESEKNLEKTSQRNRVLGYSSKTTTSNPNNSQKLLTKMQKDYNLEKPSHQKSVPRPRIRNDHNVKSSRPIKHNKEDKPPTNGCIEVAKEDAFVVPLTTKNIHAVSMNATDTVCSDNPRLPISSKENDRIEENEKENASTFADNRCVNNISNQTVIEALGAQNSEGKKGMPNANKNLKGSATGMKTVKPKITNPKPFRLLTDERRIMKEKNSDGRKHEDLLPKNVSVNSRRKDEDCNGQQGGDIQKGGGCRKIAAAKTPEMIRKTHNSVKSNNSNHNDLKPLTSSSSAHQCNPRRDLKNVLRKSTFSSRMHAMGSNLTPVKQVTNVSKE